MTNGAFYKWGVITLLPQRDGIGIHRPAAHPGQFRTVGTRTRMQGFVRKGGREEYRRSDSGTWWSAG